MNKKSEMKLKDYRLVLVVLLVVWALLATQFTEARSLLFGAMLLVGGFAARSVARWIVHAKE